MLREHRLDQLVDVLPAHVSLHPALADVDLAFLGDGGELSLHGDEGLSGGNGGPGSLDLAHGTGKLPGFLQAAAGTDAFDDGGLQRRLRDPGRQRPRLLQTLERLGLRILRRNICVHWLTPSKAETSNNVVAVVAPAFAIAAFASSQQSVLLE